MELLEGQSRQGLIDLLYGDEARVSEEGYVPYGWQFKDEEVCIEAAKGQGINCFALFSRGNKLIYKATVQTVTAGFIVGQLEGLSLGLAKPTVVVLDNARVHTAKQIKERLPYWQNRGLYIFYLPPYSPHLNLAERLWKELKARWLKPKDYQTTDTLFYAVHLALMAVGKNLMVNFSDFNYIIN